MFNFRKRPKTKTLEDFELLEINLIKDQAFDYGYVMPKSDRAIQKASLEELEELMINEPGSIRYIKEKPEDDFVLFGTKTHHKIHLLEFKIKKTNKSVLYYLLFLLVIVFVIWRSYDSEGVFYDQDNFGALLFVAIYILSTPISNFISKRRLARLKKLS